MIKTVYPGTAEGAVTAPPSKSITQRAIAAALLTGGTTIVKNPSFCDDSIAALGMAQKLGALVLKTEDGISISGSKIMSDHLTLHCGESGLAMRMFAPLSTLFSEKVTFTGEGTLLKRPVNAIIDVLRMMGVNAEATEGSLPLILTGHIKAGIYNIDGSASSQLLTGLLMTLPMADTQSEIYVENLKSKPYIDLTIQLLNDFGISVINNQYKHFIIPGRQVFKAREYVVEGDWSGSAFLLVAGAIAGSVEVKNLSPESKQADVAIIDVLKKAGAVIAVRDNSVTSTHSILKSFSFDATDSPDLFPPLAALAARCQGTSRITGISRLLYKESNRRESIISVLEKFNIRSYVQNDDLIITGSETFGAEVTSSHDHRIAMMATLLAISGKGKVIISDAEAVTKSYPDFYDIMKHLGIVIC